MLTTLILLTATRVSAEHFTFRGRDIVLEPPQGYCALDSRRPTELTTIQQRKIMLDVYGEVAMVFADCKELQQVRRGDPTQLDDLGTFSIDKENGRIVPVYGVSRQQFVDDTLKSIEKADLSNLKDFADSGARRAGLAQSIDVSSIHVLDHDDAAVYVGGTLPTTMRDGTTILRDSVDATTLINGLKIEVGVSRQSVEGGVKLLLAVQHDTVTALIRANASNDSTPARSRFDWSAAWVIAVLSAPVGLLIFLALRTGTTARKSI
jgi:hypothetical protein